MHAFYAERAAAGGAHGAKTGAVTVVQRTSSDLRLNPHLHVVFLDGAYHEAGDALAWEQLGHLKTREVGEVLERALRRMARYLRRHGALETAEGANAHADDDAALEKKLAASAVSGQAPPAGPQWLRGLSPLSPRALAYDKPLCASLDGLTLHAATRAGALDLAGREALLRYVLRPPLAQERIEPRPDGLVRIVLKRAFGDGTAAVEMDPLSLLCRLATSVPPPRLHTVKYAGVLALGEPVAVAGRAATRARRDGFGDRGDRATAESPEAGVCVSPMGGALLKRTFGVDVLRAPSAKGP